MSSKPALAMGDPVTKEKPQWPSQWEALCVIKENTNNLRKFVDYGSTPVGFIGECKLEDAKTPHPGLLPRSSRVGFCGAMVSYVS